ncbi:hypothetical protein BZG36_03695 [Bifiguratus adelaidae]|uniref:Peptide N-acetyl-beta-D-glucosaminyl asparaginase amidase A N-terminal domain-containing protein n=1 Tax=Bifiguratus adelaidae TaxID=1938954 RepID=A0A261XZC6_9FUNG|nr:hypothetical protein BZG36_03695 [Bifiguratus adelaidae]
MKLILLIGFAGLQLAWAKAPATYVDKISPLWGFVEPQNGIIKNAAATAPLKIEEIDVPVSRPDTTSCTVNIVQTTFANSYGSFYNKTYTPPAACPGPWSKVVLTLSGTSQGRQYDRLGALWMGGVEILRTSTPEPTLSGIQWTFDKDVTKYSALFAKEQLVVMELGNLITNVLNGTYNIIVDLEFYTVDKANSAPVTADAVVPVSASTNSPAWFELDNGDAMTSSNVTLPSNIRAAFIEVYATGQINDEFWYSNVPNDYADKTGLQAYGNGPFREVLVYMDGQLIGTTVPLPVVFTGGVVPSLWRPTVSIGGAFNLPTFNIDISPFVSSMVDGKPHEFQFQVNYADYYWYVDGNLHLFLDQDSNQTSGGLSAYQIAPNVTMSVKEQVDAALDANITITASRSTFIAGYVNTSQGKIVNTVTANLKYSNYLVYANQTDISTWDQTITQVVTAAQVPASHASKYPNHEIATSEVWKSSGGNVYILYSDGSFSIDGYVNQSIDNSLLENYGSKVVTSRFQEVQDGKGYFWESADTTQTSSSGSTTTSLKSRSGSTCYSRNVVASNGTIVSDKSGVERAHDEQLGTEIDLQARDWIKEQVSKEVTRLKEAGSPSLPLSIKNCGIVANMTNERRPKAINRVEVDTNFDFHKIVQVMISPPTPYPHKADYVYVNVLLFTDKPLPILIPYLYDTALKTPVQNEGEEVRDVVMKNDLKDWLFVNNLGVRARHKISEYHDI